MLLSPLINPARYAVRKLLAFLRLGPSKSSSAMTHPHKPLKQNSSEEDLVSGDLTDLPLFKNMTIKGLNGQDKADTRWTLPRLKTYDAVVFDMLRVVPDHFASQITLMDLPVFKSITAEELSSCAWSGKDKNNVCPNVVAFTRRFNHVSFWVVKEILSGQTVKIRAEILGHFIKIAKKLSDLNNFHSLLAIISALHSASVYRLTKTWNLLHKKERSTYEKLAELVSEEDNRQKLREHLNNIRLPCVPYLGMYLQDLIYIDVAHPSTGGLDSEMRSTKMNNVLRTIAEYQQSQYDLELLPHVQNYLKSVRYIEELQKFVEEDNYKLSLQLEPTVQLITKSKEDLDINEKVSSKMVAPGTPTATSKFVPGHRKSRSLGAYFLSTGTELSIPPGGFGTLGNGSRHLLDDSILEDNPHAKPSVSTCSSVEGSMNGMSIGGSSEDSEVSDDQDVWLNDGISESLEDLVQNIPEIPTSSFTVQGPLKKKSVMKNGRKVSVSSWTRFWVGLWGTNLIFYAAKTFSGPDRTNFRSKPSKMTSIVDWMVIVPESKGHNVFLLADSITGNSYKFKATSYSNTCQWVRKLADATKKSRQQVPTNLMSFE
ncbi:ras-specific guanine nucleotide-releasing factor RalGPS1-like isoform X2 [Anneissia japonica]|uniref:ras-specific guanine nucleotide-releasing factor RalGPS1-like isoform X2 n=1 Tax=Anneissia japonica TaxID=1529436 RepID=UPI001425A9B5|nr:ras-specific guanine nucleotide-releasing factor RalGPS1-like isoform X2 [Anneissia japonica]